LETPTRVLGDIVSGLLDLVYPPFCLSCGKLGADYLCPECVDKIDLIKPPCCLKCGIPYPSAYCPDCRLREFSFRSARAAGVYEGVLRDAIHSLKYHCHLVVADVLAAIMVGSFSQSGFAGQVDVVVPVPIHRSRLVERGFNQSAELARRLCKRLNLSLERDVLWKEKKTRHQVDLPEEQRTTNVRGAFAVRNVESIWQKRVLLVDDVLTTGSTASECARILVEAGAARVYVYTLARSL